MLVSDKTYTIFIQFILIFALLYFSNFLVVFNTKYFKQIYQVDVLTPPKKAFKFTLAVKG